MTSASPILGAFTALPRRRSPGLTAGGGAGTVGRIKDAQAPTQFRALPPLSPATSSVDRMPTNRRETILATCALANPFLARKRMEADKVTRYDLAI